MLERAGERIILGEGRDRARRRRTTITRGWPGEGLAGTPHAFTILICFVLLPFVHSRRAEQINLDCPESCEVSRRLAIALLLGLRTGNEFFKKQKKKPHGRWVAFG
jgi:hypothetical protein